MGSFPFARRYLGNRVYFLFLWVLRCFSSPRSLLLQAGDGIAPAGLPHSEIHGSMGICPSPWLIAACHVLLRLREPQASPMRPSCSVVYLCFYWKSFCAIWQCYFGLARFYSVRCFRARGLESYSLTSSAGSIYSGFCLLCVNKQLRAACPLPVLSLCSLGWMARGSGLALRGFQCSPWQS